jgi:tryptophanyl-tRNA synthetase
MAENLNRALEPIREKRRALEADPDTVRAVMAQGTEKAKTIARKTMEEVRETVRI